MAGAETHNDERGTAVSAAGRAVAAFAALALGMVVARAVPAVTALVWLGACGAACAAAGLLRGRGSGATLGLGAFLLGAAVFAARVNAPSRDVLTRIIEVAEGGGVVLTVEGVALDSARGPVMDSAMSRFGAARPEGSFSLRAERVLTEGGWEACASVLWCRVPGTTYSKKDGLGGFGVRAGNRVRLTGLGARVREWENPGDNEAALRAAQDSVAGTLRAESPELVVVTEATARGARAWLARARDVLHARAMLALDPAPGVDSPGRALILSLFLGDSEVGERELRASFTRLGLAHVLAISGLHVVVLAGVGLFLVRLTGERGALEPVIVSVLVVLYLLAVPASAPVIRAGVMTLALLAGEALGRRHDRVAIIAWCAAGIVLWRPLDLWSLGFQLSFGLTALLLWLGGRAQERFFGPRIKGLVPVRRTLWRRGLSETKAALSASVLCWGASVPLIMLRTGLLSPLAVVTTLVTLPAMTLLMWAGYVVLIAGLVWPGAAGAMHPALLRVSDVCAALVRWLDGMPGVSLRLPPVGVWWAIAAIALVVAWFARNKRRDGVCLVGLVVVAVWLAVEWVSPRQWLASYLPVGNERVRVDALALGRGSCVLVRAGGKSVLVNCGSDNLKAGQRTIPAALRELGAWRVKTIVITAPDLEHLSAVPDVIEPLGVRSVLLYGPAAREAEERPESAAAWLVTHLRGRGVEVRSAALNEAILFGIEGVMLMNEARGEDENPSRAAPVYATLTGQDPRVLFGGDLDGKQLDAVLDATNMRAGAGIVIAGRRVRDVPRTGAVVLWNSGAEGLETDRVLTTAYRSGWALLYKDGTSAGGRHGR